MTTLEEKVKRITQIKRKMTMNNQNIANLIPIQSKARKQLIHTSRMIKKKEKENKKLLKEKEELSEEIKTHLSERIKRPIGQKNGFDDELFENFNTVDILVTDTEYTPHKEEERSEIWEYMKNIKYNPSQESKKYGYDKILQLRLKKNKTNGEVTQK